MSIITQAQQNSSLVNSLMDATQSVSNPFKYSIEKQVAFHGVQWISTDPVNASSFGPSSSIDFDLTKFGFLRSAVFSWKSTPPANCKDVPPSGTLNGIDRIELLSASRRLAVMDRHALRCALSDMPQEIRSNYLKGLHSVSNGKQMEQSGTDAYDSHLFVPMSFFCNVRNSLALNFVEPVKLRVVMSDNQYCVKRTGASGVGTGIHNTKGTMALSNPNLFCEYRILDPETEDDTINENYDSVLTQLGYDYHTETEVTGTLTAGADLDMKVEIKDPSVVSAAYVIVSCDYQDVHSAAEIKDGEDGSVATSDTRATKMQGNMVAAEQPLILTKIGLKASGQDIVPQDTPARIFELFGRRNLSSEYHACGFGNTYQSRDDPANLHNVYKIPFELDSDNRYNSSGISLRELNAPTISVTVRQASGTGTLDGEGGADEGQKGELTGKLGSNANPGVLDGKKVTMRVVLKKHVLHSTDPQNGRMVQSISN